MAYRVRHREERNDVAITSVWLVAGNCFAALAMTGEPLQAAQFQNLPDFFANFVRASKVHPKRD